MADGRATKVGKLVIGTATEADFHRHYHHRLLLPFSTLSPWSNINTFNSIDRLTVSTWSDPKRRDQIFVAQRTCMVDVIEFTHLSSLLSHLRTFTWLRRRIYGLHFLSLFFLWHNIRMHAIPTRDTNLDDAHLIHLSFSNCKVIAISLFGNEGWSHDTGWTEEMIIGSMKDLKAYVLLLFYLHLFYSLVMTPHDITTAVSLRQTTYTRLHSRFLSFSPHLSSFRHECFHHPVYLSPSVSRKAWSNTTNQLVSPSRNQDTLSMEVCQSVSQCVRACMYVHLFRQRWVTTSPGGWG